jgi:two-component system, OmpR family, response regulator RegX3
MRRPNATTSSSSRTYQPSNWPLRGPVRVLLALRQRLVADLVSLTLKHGPYDTRTTLTSAEALTQLATWQPHLVLIDMDLDDGGLARAIPSASVTARVPMIALTRRGNLSTKLAAFAAGVDDILTIPFVPEELLARVVAVVRRSYSNQVTFTPTITLGELEIDILNRTVHTDGTELHLTSPEQSLLYLLAANAGRVVTRDEILDSLWGTDYVAESNIVDRQIRNLRARLRDNWREPRFIATVPGMGYRFVAPLADQADGAGA